LKTENLNLKRSKAYDACPYCLTELTAETDSEPPAEAPLQETGRVSLKQQTEKGLRDMPAEPSAKPQKCGHQFGYLSKRESKESIPEECMMCESIVQCMLKNLTG
jgi:hypothetical protein